MEVMFDDVHLWLFSPAAVVPWVVSFCTVLLSWRFLRREWNVFWQLGEHELQERRLPWFPSLTRHAEIRLAACFALLCFACFSNFVLLLLSGF